MSRRITRLRERPLSILTVLVMASLWEIISRLGIFHQYFMPPLSLILLRLAEMIMHGELLPHIKASITRILFGFLIASTLAVPIGVVLGWSKKVYRIFEPAIEMLRPIPPISLIPIAILWFGIGDESKVFIIAFSCFFPVLINTIYGVRGVDNYLIRSAKTLGAERYHIMKEVVLPAALPYIFAGVRVGLAIAFMSLIAAEMVAANAGLGFLIIISEQTFRIKEMYATLLTILLLGYLSAAILIRIENHYTGWHKAITLQRAM